MSREQDNSPNAEALLNDEDKMHSMGVLLVPMSSLCSRVLMKQEPEVMKYIDSEHLIILSPNRDLGGVQDSHARIRLRNLGAPDLLRCGPR